MTARRADTALRAALFMLAAACCPVAGAQPAIDGLAPYRAVYGLFNGDKRVGESVFLLRYDSESGRYEFESRSELHGLLRLASPRPLIERSVFVVINRRIRPLSFTYEDGSRSGRRNVDVTFDWATRRIIANAGDVRRELPLPELSLDRASARVALTRDLAASREHGVYAIADPDEVQSYEYHSEGMETVTTALGEIRAIKIRQQRPGSSRRTLTWSAPRLGFVAIRIEQRRDDRNPVAFVLESLEWL